MDFGASLPDMMTALSKADAAGNQGDAAQLAHMISQAYPDHTAAMLAATPPSYKTIASPPSGPQPPMPNVAPVATPPLLPGGLPPRASLVNPTPGGPINPGVALPNFPAAQTGSPSPQGAPPAGLGDVASGGSPPAPPQAATGLAGIAQDLMGAVRGYVGAIPGGNFLAAGLRATGDTAIGALGGSVPQVPGGFGGRVAAYQQAMTAAN